jgi:O-antigen/teichoic acid export membrane protein
LPALKDIRDKIRSGSFSELSVGSFRSFTLRILGTLVSYLFTIVVTHHIGDEGYGTFMLAQTIMMVSVMVARMGVDTVLLRWISSLRANGNEDLVPSVFNQGLRFVLPVSLLLTLIFWGLAPWLGELLFEAPDASLYLRWITLGILPMSLIFLSSEALRGLKEVEWAMLLRNVVPFGVGAIIVYFFHASGDPMDPIRGFLIGLLLACMLGLAVWGKRSGWNGRRIEEGSYGLKRMLVTGLPLLFSGSMFFIMNHLDLLMLGYFMQDADVGDYSAAMRVANLCNVALFAVNMIAAPKFAEKYASGDLDGLDRIVRRATQMVFAVVFPLVLIIVLFAGPILHLFGPDFQEGRSALYLLALGKFLNAASGSVMYLLQMTGRERVGLWILSVAALGNVVMNLLLIPAWGIDGAAMASMIAIGGWNIYGGVYIWKKDHILTFSWPFRRG